MINKIILLFTTLLFLTCVTDQDQRKEDTKPSYMSSKKIIKIPELFKCTYEYFFTTKGILDSLIIACPDQTPPGSPE